MRPPISDGHRSGNFKRLLQRIRGIDQYVLSLFDRSLILHAHIYREVVAA